MRGRNCGFVDNLGCNYVLVLLANLMMRGASRWLGPPTMVSSLVDMGEIIHSIDISRMIRNSGISSGIRCYNAWMLILSVIVDLRL